MGALQGRKSCCRGGSCDKIFETPLYPYLRSPDQDAQKPVRHPVIVVGAGPIGLAAAIDLPMQDMPVVVLDENDKVSWGSRAICFAKRPLEILDRLGCGDRWSTRAWCGISARSSSTTARSTNSTCCRRQGHKRPAFINLQQYHFEKYLVDRVRELQAEGKPIELRGGNKVRRRRGAGRHARHHRRHAGRALSAGRPTG